MFCFKLTKKQKQAVASALEEAEKHFHAGEPGMVLAQISKEEENTETVICRGHFFKEECGSKLLEVIRQNPESPG